MRQVVVLGLDAATLEIINPLMEEGLLPNFQSICRRGVHGALRSTLHPLSPPAWSSFITGKNPGKHGIYDFVVHKPGSYELLYTNGGMRKGKSLWRILSDEGKKVAVVNVPMTYPPENVNGVMISGFDSPGVDSDFIRPGSVYKEITRDLGTYLLRDYPQGHTPASFIEHIEELFEFHKKLTFYILENYEWDFFMIVFSVLDIVQHGYWQYMDPAFTGISAEDRKKFGNVIRDFYIKTDGLLGDLLEKVKDKNLIIMSDHGAGPCYKAIFINNWLKDIGLLEYKRSSRDGNVSSGIKDMAFNVLAQIHYQIKNRVSPEGLERLKRAFPGLRHKVKSRLVFGEIDWDRTKVYSFGRESTNLFINMNGKFPGGIVMPGREYDELISFLKEKLMELRDPDSGEPVVEGIYRGSEIYHGESMESAPDLLITWRNSEYTSWPGYNDRNRKIFETSLDHSDYSDWSQLQKGGNHRPYGIVFMDGEGIKRNEVINSARIIDLAPTILYWMGLAIPDDMDGKVLLDAFDDAYKAGNSPQKSATAGLQPADSSETIYSEEEKKAIEERLKSLGYV
ncbi:MAG: hypothetical protein C4560_09765 [Nitrospiraceae bacterium]|nr:MAG: hypothetical protein C4560_09765 [Nitrospiraceae bacterium]